MVRERSETKSMLRDPTTKFIGCSIHDHFNDPVVPGAVLDGRARGCGMMSG